MILDLIILILAILQAATIWLLLRELFAQRPIAMPADVAITAKPETADAPAVSEPPVPSHVWERLEKLHVGWILAGHVREGSPAWHKALETPGIALRSPAGEIIEGNQ